MRQHTRLNVHLFATVALAWPCVLASQRGGRGVAPPRSDSSIYGALSYRYIGPPGNRVIAVAGVPGDPATYYAGAASGGIWKTTDGGTHWLPIFDAQPVSSIGALAIAPSNTSVIWAGTGESFIRSHISLGWGMFRSTDAGATWQRAGLEATGRIARIAIDPHNPDVVLVAALGHAYAPQPDRGIFRTTDGGKNWRKVLFVNDSTGGIDVVMDPNDPNIVYAATWQVEIHTWGRFSGGAGSALWRSRDGGVTWTRLAGSGLPTHIIGKIGLGVSKANPNRVYALIETGKGIPYQGQPTDIGILWRSDNGGDHWTLVNSTANLLARPAYYTRMAVAPDNADEAYFLAIGFSFTRDGGATLTPRSEAQSPGFDNHDMWIDPLNPKRMAVANDEGVSLTINRGQSWARIRLPIAQLYHVTTDNRVPYTVCGNMQDGPSTCGPSNSKYNAGDGITGGADIPRGAWYSVGGGESGWATPDTVNPNIVWSTASGRGSVGGIVVRTTLSEMRTRDVEVWPVSVNGHSAAQAKYRFVWDFPITISPHNHNRVYVGSQFLHVTMNDGQSWSVMSPDLTRNDKSKQQHSGGIWGDNIGVEYADVIYAIAESPITPGLIWIGTNDGLVQLTRDAGQHWENVTHNMPQMPAWATVSNIEPSRYHAGTAYLTVNGHQEGNFDPWVFKTADFGKTWQLIVDGLPHTPIGFARCVREDPHTPGLLYLGTENALYVSFDDGSHWQPLQLNLPHAPVSWLTIQPHFNDLVVSTYGRGFYIVDDVTALQQLTPGVRTSASHLFAPRPAYRFRFFDTSIRQMSDDGTAGMNPPYGAFINYWLGSVPSGDVSITIADSSGKLLRTFAGPRVPGVNRIVWDLRFDPGAPAAATPVTRVGGAPPVGAEEGAVGPPQGGRGQTRLNVLAPPGRYTVKMRVDGREQQQLLVVLKDPKSGGSTAAIVTQTTMLVALAADLAAATTVYDGIENVRAQLRTLAPKLASDSTKPDVREAAAALERTFTLLADSVVQQKPGAFYEWPVKLSAKLSYLAGEVQGSDALPTDQAREAHTFLREQLRMVRADYAALIAKDLAAFNALLRQRGVAPILTVVP